MTEPKVGKNTGNAGKGRPKGSPNKSTALLKDAILRAAELAGGPEDDKGNGGLVAYLQTQATANPGPFMALLGKVLPMQIGGDPDNPVVVSITRRIVNTK
jgi:hypothetical protein